LTTIISEQVFDELFLELLYLTGYDIVQSCIGKTKSVITTVRIGLNERKALGKLCRLAKHIIFKRKWPRINLAWRNSIKRVTLSFKRHGSRSVAFMRYGCYGYANGLWFDSHLADFRFLFFL